MAYFHKNLTQEKWDSYSVEQQILNIASELNRAKNWILEENNEYKNRSIERVLELMDITSNDKKWKKTRGKLRELRRLRELMGELYVLEKINKIYPVQLLKTLLSFSGRTYSVEI